MGVWSPCFQYDVVVIRSVTSLCVILLVDENVVFEYRDLMLFSLRSLYYCICWPSPRLLEWVYVVGNQHKHMFLVGGVVTHVPLFCWPFLGLSLGSYVQRDTTLFQGNTSTQHRHLTHQSKPHLIYYTPSRTRITRKGVSAAGGASVCRLYTFSPLFYTRQARAWHYYRCYSRLNKLYLYWLILYLCCCCCCCCSCWVVAIDLKAGVLVVIVRSVLSVNANPTPKEGKRKQKRQCAYPFALFIAYVNSFTLFFRGNLLRMFVKKRFGLFTQCTT